MSKSIKLKRYSQKKKLQKSKDKSRCCNTCNFCDKRNKEDPICSITAESVRLDGVCDRINTEVQVKCQSCGKEISYKSKDEYYESCYKFEMESGCGNSSAQRIHLCKKCARYAIDVFDEMLENITHRVWSKEVNNTENDDK